MRRPGQLFRNNGDGTFTDVAKKTGMDRKAFTKSAAWGDYNDDGFPDLYVSNFEAENFLYHNNGDAAYRSRPRAWGRTADRLAFQSGSSIMTMTAGKTCLCRAMCSRWPKSLPSILVCHPG